MKKIKAVIFVAPMGHDVGRTSAKYLEWMDECGIFDAVRVGDFNGSRRSIQDYCRDKTAMDATDLFVFVCSDYPFENPDVRGELERQIASGKGVVFTHGLHPCFQSWPEAEKMIGLLWRDTASHGDFDMFTVKKTGEHPITAGIEPFQTKEELFCGLTNVHDVPLTVLLTAHSPKERISRHGHPGTGNEEPVLTLGRYGKGSTVDFLLGHVWPFYTGHGLLEDTLISMMPKEFKILYLRCCEWAAKGVVEYTS